MYKITIVLAVILVALAVTVVVVSVTRRRELRWEIAKANPSWEPWVSTYGSETFVSVALIARDGRRSFTYKKTLIGSVDIADPCWDMELQILRERAEQRVEGLNRARNRGGE